MAKLGQVSIGIDLQEGEPCVKLVEVAQVNTVTLRRAAEGHCLLVKQRKDSPFQVLLGPGVQEAEPSDAALVGP